MLNCGNPANVKKTTPITLFSKAIIVIVLSFLIKYTSQVCNSGFTPIFTILFKKAFITMLVSLAIPSNAWFSLQVSRYCFLNHYLIFAEPHIQ